MNRIVLLRALFFVLMAIVAKMGINADPVWATIVDIGPDLTGMYNLYFIDKNGDGLEDGVVRIHSRGDTAPIFNRYMRVGGRVLYENENRDDFNVSDFQLLRIETPDGRLIKVVDFAGQYSNYQHAREFEARQHQRGE